MTTQSHLEPFEPGDIFVGATDLNNPEDDHAGDGRIFQFDKDFNKKAVLYTPGTTHLVKGLVFAPDGVLWAFDTASYSVIRVDPETGTQLPEIKFADRPFGSAFFDSDGNVYFNEHTTGTLDDVPENIRHNYSPMPGTDRIGDGNIYKYTQGGELLDTYETETSTSFAGFLGVTSMALHPSGKSITYTTETSKRIMRYDIVNKVQMPDLVQLPQDQPEYVFCLDYMADGNLVVTRGAKIEIIDDQGDVVRSYPMEGRGWATIIESRDAKHMFVTSFFQGLVLKLDKETGAIVNEVGVNVERSLAGIAEYPG